MHIGLGTGVTGQSHIAVPLVGGLVEVGVEPIFNQAVGVGLMRRPVNGVDFAGVGGDGGDPVVFFT